MGGVVASWQWQLVHAAHLSNSGGISQFILRMIWHFNDVLYGQP
jgi:hypothetical protein